jgi:integrase
MNLTVKRVTKLLRHGRPGRHRDGDVRGLYLCVGGKKNAHWSLRYQLNHRSHWMGLGSAREFSLHQARDRANEQRRKLADKDDPLLLRRADRSAKAAAAANNVAAIGSPHVLDVMRQRVEASRGNPAGEFWRTRAVTADRTRNRIDLILTWAAAQGFRSGENPARSDLVKNVPAPTAKAVVHYAAVPYDEVPALVAALRDHRGISARALEFLILTATRTKEVRGATWDEIDLDNALWTIPAARMKGGKEHKVPLPKRAVEILRGLPREADNPHAFIGAQQPRLSMAALNKLMKRLRPAETVHGLRSSFSDWANEQTSHSVHSIEMSLAHSVGNNVEQAYRRGPMFDKRRRLMADWARFCTTPTRRTRGSTKVTPLRPKVAS